MIFGDPVTFSSATKLNIDYGSAAPADTIKLWVPLSQKPSKVFMVVLNMQTLKVT